MDGWKILGGTLLVVGLVVAAPVVIVTKVFGAEGRDTDSPPTDPLDPSSPYNDYP